MNTHLLVIVGMLLSEAVAQAPAPAGAPPSPRTAAQPMGPIPGPAEQTRHPDNPYAKDAAAMMEGRQLFVNFNCSGCHGGHAGGGMGPSLRDKTWLYGGKPGEIFASISEGRPHGMPAWGTMLPREQIWKLVAYIGALRTPQEPQPPR